MSFSPAGGANSVPPNLAGFEGPLQGGKREKKRKRMKGRKGRKNAPAPI